MLTVGLPVVCVCECIIDAFPPAGLAVGEAEEAGLALETGVALARGLEDAAGVAEAAGEALAAGEAEAIGDGLGESVGDWPRIVTVDLVFVTITSLKSSSRSVARV